MNVRIEKKKMHLFASEYVKAKNKKFENHGRDTISSTGLAEII